MKNKQHYNKQTILELVAVVSYILISIISLYLAQFFDRVVLGYQNYIDIWEVAPWVIIFAITFTSYFKCYAFMERRLLDLIYSTYMSVFCVNMATLILPYFGMQLKISKKILLLNLIIQLIIMTIWVISNRKLHFEFIPQLQMTVITNEKDINKSIIKDKIKETPKYKVKQVLSYKDKDLYTKIRQTQGVIVDNVDNKTKQELISFALDQEIPCIIRPSYEDIVLKATEVEQFGDVTMLTAKTRGLNILDRLFKRIIDIVVSLIGLIVSSPIIIYFAYKIKKQDGANPFFVQDRLTKDGKSFGCYKLRTMIVNAEKQTGAVLAQKDDKRITPLGQKLRDMRIDELPQLLNVLKGEMSIVGPRAERQVFYDEYQQTLPEFRHRLGIKAGITGYAQVYGRYDTTPKDKLMMDLIYIQTYSPLLDLRIIIETVLVVLNKRVY